MSDLEVVSLKIFGRDITLSCPAEEKPALLNAAELLNTELNGIENKSNALILAGLNLANKFLQNNSSSASSPEDADKLQIMLRDIEEVLEK